jgi:hypothetical protein
MKRKEILDRIFQATLILGASLAGYLAEAPFVNMAHLFVFPVIWMETQGRMCAYLAAACYYLAASYGLVATAPVYWGLTTYADIAAHLTLVWIGSSLTLALPWGILWTDRDSGCKSKIWRLAAIFILLIVPPLGLWGWANPLLCAGYLFPYTREAGLVCVFLIWGLLWHFSGSRRLLFYAACAVFFAYTAYMSPIARIEAKAPKDWHGAVTSFGLMMSGSSSELTMYMRRYYLSELLSRTAARYVVLPETVAGKWDEDTELLWSPTTVSFLQAGRTYFVGAEIFLQGTEKYYNVVQIRGANNKTIRQRFPVTYSAWRPFGDGGAIANWFDEPGTVFVDGLKVGVLICFEPFIYLPALVTMLSHPDVLVVCSNHWWCRNSNISLTSDKIAGSWSLLFNVPLVLSKNS